MAETIAILGGTGDLGTGLAIRWSKAGYKIIIGSRTKEKAVKAVTSLKKVNPNVAADAMINEDAAKIGDIVVLTVPASHQLSTLEGVKQYLTGKILIDVTVPLVPPKVGTVQLPAEGSAGSGTAVFSSDPVFQKRGRSAGVGKRRPAAPACSAGSHRVSGRACSH